MLVLLLLLLLSHSLQYMKNGTKRNEYMTLFSDIILLDLDWPQIVPLDVKTMHMTICSRSWIIFSGPALAMENLGNPFIFFTF